MITRYRLVVERLQADLQALEHVVQRAEYALARATREVQDLAVPQVRPAVLSSETRAALMEYLEFRHVVRNVYTFNLRPERVAELVRGLRPTFDLTRRDLLNFAAFLEELTTADEI